MCVNSLTQTLVYSMPTILQWVASAIQRCHGRAPLGWRHRLQFLLLPLTESLSPASSLRHTVHWGSLMDAPWNTMDIFREPATDSSLSLSLSSPLLLSLSKNPLLTHFPETRQTKQTLSIWPTLSSDRTPNCSPASVCVYIQCCSWESFLLLLQKLLGRSEPKTFPLSVLIIPVSQCRCMSPYERQNVDRDPSMVQPSRFLWNGLPLRDDSLSGLACTREITLSPVPVSHYQNRTVEEN